MGISVERKEKKIKFQNDEKQSIIKLLNFALVNIRQNYKVPLTNVI